MIVGRLTDIFGRRWFFIIGSSIALLGSIVCATAPKWVNPLAFTVQYMAQHANIILLNLVFLL
jgi:MFS family permease